MKWINDDGEELGNLDFFCVKYKKEGEENFTQFYYNIKHLEKMGITHMSYGTWDLIVDTLFNKDDIILSWDRAENESYLIQYGFERLE